MVNSIYSWELQLPTLILALVGLLVLSRYLPLWLAIPLAIAKAAIPFTYFGGLWGHGWTLQDDLTYFEVGYDILSLGYTPLDLLFDEAGQQLLLQSAQSRHTLYYFWNVLAQYIFGKYYFAPIYCNLMLVYITSMLLARTLQLLDFRRHYIIGAITFHALHWDYLSWTSLINVKEALVECLVWVSLYFFISFMLQKRWRCLACSIVACLVMMQIRLYIPGLLVAAASTWLMLNSLDYRKFFLLPLGLCLIVVFHAEAQSAMHFLQPHYLAMGTIRFLLTPQPWSIVPEYSFLLLPAFFQWAFLPCAAFGFLWLWKTSPYSRLFLVMLATFVVFYAIVPESQGPRHRVQLAAIFAWLQFHFIWCFFVASSAFNRRHDEQPVTTAKERICVALPA